ESARQRLELAGRRIAESLVIARAQLARHLVVAHAAGQSRLQPVEPRDGVVYDRVITPVGVVEQLECRLRLLRTQKRRRRQQHDRGNAHESPLFRYPLAALQPPVNDSTRAGISAT